MIKSQFPLALAVGALVASSFSCGAATYTVTSLSDSPKSGTLRWAIQQANANPGSTIDFAVNGTISLSAPLPGLRRSMTIDGTSAPGYKGAPVVAVDFANKAGLTVGAGAGGSTIRGLSLGGASNSGLTILGSSVTVDGNYIGLTPTGGANPNRGDGVKIAPASRGNVIGSTDPVRAIAYFNTTNAKAFTVQPVTAWQGIRNYKSSAKQFLICGTSNEDGLLYVGPLAGGGRSFKVDVPHAASTSVYGPDNLDNGRIRLVGSYKRQNNERVFNHGFVWEGTLKQLPSGGKFRTIDYPGAKYQFTHSTMGGLAVGNADGPTKSGAPIGPGIAYIYDVESGKFVARIRYPKSKSNSAYGIWYNGGTSYTICGGYSPLATNNLTNQSIPLAQGRGFLVDYDSSTKTFSHWKTFVYRNGQTSVPFITHFEGISSVEDGVYTLNADSVRAGSDGPARGSWVTVRRNTNGTFGVAQWVDLHYKDSSGEAQGVTSSNSVHGYNVVGLVIGPDKISYQASLRVGHQLSNVISGNRGNGVGIYGSRDNVVAQNYIGTNPAGTRAIPNGGNGILLANRAARNLIGGQATGGNNPTGSEGRTTPVFVVPPQGNLVSGNRENGILLTNGATRNTLSGNFVGTDRTGNKAIGNGGDGVLLVHAPKNSLIGCTFQQSPFVFYNVCSGNGGDGVKVLSSDDVTIQANFMGIGANNAVLVPNAGNGLAIAGSSKNTQVGGVIPLGNVISGNTRNGIAVTDTVSGFLSFNTFGGGFAFGGAAPNGGDGVYISATGGNNEVRTCILSGNTGNGLHIGGDATGVQVTDTACGTNTHIDAALPNGANGVLISDTAHGNALGGFQPSIEMRTHFSGNVGYGVAVVGQAHDNTIYNSNIGLGFAQPGFTDPTIPNQTGGVYLGPGTSNTTLGGTGILACRVNTNIGAGLVIDSSTGNSVVNNQIEDNTTYGLFGTGTCTGTNVTNNTITGNATNVDISGATGITVTP
jgi:hypothetical protein